MACTARPSIFPRSSRRPWNAPREPVRRAKPTSSARAWLSTRVGGSEQLALLAEVARETYRLEEFSSDDVDRARAILERYSALDLGLADASIVVLAGRHNTRDVLTLDERHFRAVRAPRGRRFRLLPADLPQR